MKNYKLLEQFLSKLIKACGDGFIGLDRVDDGWRAIGQLKNKGIVIGTSKTPEIAVAKLYQKLKQ